MTRTSTLTVLLDPTGLEAELRESESTLDLREQESCRKNIEEEK